MKISKEQIIGSLGKRLDESFALFINLEFGGEKGKKFKTYLEEIKELYKGEEEKLISILNAFARKRDELMKDSLEESRHAMEEYAKDSADKGEEETDQLFLYARSKIRKANYSYGKLLPTLHEEIIAGSEKIISDFYDEAFDIYKKYSGAKTRVSV